MDRFDKVCYALCAVYIISAATPIVMKMNGHFQGTSWFWIMAPIAIPVSIISFAALVFFIIYKYVMNSKL